MSNTGNPTITAHSPADVIAIAPYLLGFHPEASLVLIGLNTERIEITARLDLADVHPASLTAVFQTIAGRAGCSRVITVVFGEPSTAAHLQQDLEQAAELHEVQLLDCLCVSDGRWRSLICVKPSCCPPDGVALEQDSASSVAAVYAGMTASTSRARLMARLDPLPESEREALRPLLVDEERRVAEAVRTSQLSRYDRAVIRGAHHASRAGNRVSDEQAALLLVGLSYIPIRDKLWLAVDDEPLDGSALWLDLARRAPSPYDAAPLFLFAWQTWRQGNGALAREAAAQVLRSQPGYSAARLLLIAIDQAVDPRATPRLREPNIRGAHTVALC